MADFPTGTSDTITIHSGKTRKNPIILLSFCNLNVSLFLHSHEDFK